MTVTTRDPDSIVGQVFIKAPPVRVFRALTDPEELIAWWGDPKMYWCTSWTLDLKPGGKWRSEGTNVQGAAFVVEGKFLAIDAPRLLSYTWKPSWADIPTTTVKIELVAKDGGTDLTWTHSGFAGYAKALEDHKGGLGSVIGWLQAYVETGRVVGAVARQT